MPPTVDDLDRSDDRPLEELDDELDRDELRNRYYGLLQELRVMLPGVQVLLAFLLTVPFTERFHDIDHLGHVLYSTSLLAAALSVVLLLTPTALHRIGERTARQERLRWGIRCTVAGAGSLAVSTIAAVLCVTRLVHGSGPAVLLTGVVAGAILLCWVVLPRTLDSSRRGATNRLIVAWASARSESWAWTCTAV